MVGRLLLCTCIAITGVLSFGSPALAGLRALDQMMAELAPSSAQSAETIRRVYHQHLDFLTLREYDELAGALDNGGLVPLPEQPLRFNIVPRLDGLHPIGEKDLANQTSYTAARAATIGALLDIASRVKTGPIEVTSLVRHSDYQEDLRATNRNAITSVPMHTMGLAADIGLVNTPLATIYEIRDVLRRMQDQGDILFIGERKQLVFHVVPHPSRLGHFNEVYLRAVGAPLTSRSAAAHAFLDAPRLLPGRLTAEVTTEVIAMLPAEGPILNLLTESPPAAESPAVPARSQVGIALAGAVGYWRGMSGANWLAILVAALSSCLLVSRRPAVATLFDKSA